MGIKKLKPSQSWRHLKIRYLREATNCFCCSSSLDFINRLKQAFLADPFGDIDIGNNREWVKLVK